LKLRLDRLLFLVLGNLLLIRLLNWLLLDRLRQLLDRMRLLLDRLRLRLEWLDGLLLNRLLLNRLLDRLWLLLHNRLNRLLLDRLGLGLHNRLNRLLLSLERLNGLLKRLLLLDRLRLRLDKRLLLLLSRVRRRPLLSVRRIRLNPSVSALRNNPISTGNLLLGQLRRLLAGRLSLRRPIPRGSSGVRVNISLLRWNTLLLGRDTLQSTQPG
jgi:hypothetical protein